MMRQERREARGYGGGRRQEIVACRLCWLGDHGTLREDCFMGLRVRLMLMPPSPNSWPGTTVYNLPLFSFVAVPENMYFSHMMTDMLVTF
jgi:hypothetical protein